MNERDPFAIGEFEKELLELYIKHGYGGFKMYDLITFPLSSCVNDETALLTLQEFYNKSHPLPEVDFSWD